MSEQVKQAGGPEPPDGEPIAPTTKQSVPEAQAAAYRTAARFPVVTFGVLLAGAALAVVWAAWGRREALLLAFLAGTLALGTFLQWVGWRSPGKDTPGWRFLER